MRIQTNIMALNTHRQLGVNNLNQTKSTEKLASGFRINRAADDASGLSISEKMRSQIRGLGQASANSQDGISMIQAAEGALTESHSILQRMRELGVKAANDINETEDRGAIQSELDQLTKEIDRIAYTTEFNKKTLMDGSLQNGGYATKLLAGNAVGAGTHVNAAIAASNAANNVAVEDMYTINVDTVGKYTTTTESFDLTGLKAGTTVSVTMSFDNTADVPGSKAYANQQVFTYTTTGDAGVDNAAFINGLKESMSKVVKDYDISTEGSTITFKAKGIGDSYQQMKVKATASGGTISQTQTNAVTGQHAVISIKAGQAAAAVTINTAVSGNAGGTFVNNVFTEKTTGLTFTIQDLTKKGTSIVEVKAGKDLALQVGANSGANQVIRIGIQSVSASSLGIDNLSVGTHESSQAAVAAMDIAIKTVSRQRSELGAIQNRLEYTVSNLDTVAENIAAAESRIREVDMAKEMMNFTKYNIINQAAIAMLAQANQAPQSILSLLR